MSSARLVLPAVVLLTSACTDAKLFGQRAPTTPDKVAFSGNLCTSDPTERAFPVRVLFLVDTSIGDGDYISARGDSIERVTRQFAGPNYSYGIIRYSGILKGTTCGLRNLTPDGFTKNLEDAIAGVRCADLANPGRNIVDALSLASSFISGDVLKTPLGIRSRTKYVVVLLSNGPPSVSLSNLWCSTQQPPIRDAAECEPAYFDEFCADARPPPASCERYQYTRIVREMREFALNNGAQEMYFHSVYQRDPDQAGAMMDDPGATDLLSELALTGGGSLFRFPGGGTCDVMMGDARGCLFSTINIDSTQAVFQRKQLIVSNRSALPTAKGLLPDSDQDGLADEEELVIGTSPILADTDGDLLGDRIEHLLRRVGLDPLVDQNSIPNGWPVECPRPGSPSLNAFPPDQDLDGDRLTDCEEILLRANPTLFDTDADGVADPLEFRMGTNLIDDDALLDTDADGLVNVDEHRLHLDPLARDPNTDKIYSYEFSREEEQHVLAFTQPLPLTGVTVFGTSFGSRAGRGTLVYTPPPDFDREVGPDNIAYIAWRDPQATVPGPNVAVTGDGVFKLFSDGSVPGDGELSITVQVSGYLLPTSSVRTDIFLRASRRSCFDFRVADVLLVPTLTLPDTGIPGVNYIDVFLSEVPSNNPDTYGVFRVATIPLIYPADPTERAIRPDLELIDSDFLLFGE